MEVGGLDATHLGPDPCICREKDATIVKGTEEISLIWEYLGQSEVLAGKGVDKVPWFG